MVEREQGLFTSDLNIRQAPSQFTPCWYSASRAPLSVVTGLTCELSMNTHQPSSLLKDHGPWTPVWGWHTGTGLVWWEWTGRQRAPCHPTPLSSCWCTSCSSRPSLCCPAYMSTWNPAMRMFTTDHWRGWVEYKDQNEPCRSSQQLSWGEAATAYQPVHQPYWLCVRGDGEHKAALLVCVPGPQVQDPGVSKHNSFQ